VNSFKTKQDFISYIRNLKREGNYVYFREIEKSFGPTAQFDGKTVIMVGSNDYLGLSSDERVCEAASNAIRRWGSGPGGSRFLCGNMSIISELEEDVADLVGKKRAVVHTTGFMVNSGSFACLTDPGDLLLCDRESHASIFEGAAASKAKMSTFPHNDVKRARKMLAKHREENPESCRTIVTEGVFSMSGSIADLPNIVTLKQDEPELKIFLDDAHGLGVMGQGRGTAAHFGLTDDVDIIMGTFSKSLASIGGFIATNDDSWLEYLKHRSRTLMFSAALPAASAAAAQESCKIIREEPDRVQRLWDLTAKARAGFKARGLEIIEAEGPVIGVLIGNEEAAFRFSLELLERGIFALPAIYPAVALGKAIIRVAFMSTHEDHHVEQTLDIFQEVADLLYQEDRQPVHCVG
jgi:glycine C-acetyltransferase